VVTKKTLWMSSAYDFHIYILCSGCTAKFPLDIQKRLVIGCPREEHLDPVVTGTYLHP
jgi:hypothetical protein